MIKVRWDKEFFKILLVSLFLSLYEVFQGFVLTFRDTVTHEERTRDFQRPCRVVVENKVDFHHEILESVVLRFPLPFHKFNCSTEEPVIYDFALYQNRFHLKIPGLTGSGAKDARFLNETEFWGWKNYFEENLQYRVFDRTDKTNPKTKAYFNNLVSYEEISSFSVDAVIDATCDIGPSYIMKMKRNDNFYCVLHGSNKNLLSTWPRAYERSCFLSPMWPENQCTFLAADLPKVKKLSRKKSNGLDICVHGVHRHNKAAEMFLGFPFKKHNASLHVFYRHYPRNFFEQLTLKNVPFRAEMELNFVKYHTKIAQCDTMVVLHEPSLSAEYFSWGDKSSSGIVPALVAYKLPSIMHSEFAKIYKHQLSASVETFEDQVESKTMAMTRMIETIVMKR
jgi:hypothetical protein